MLENFASGVCKLFHTRWGFSCGSFAEESRSFLSRRPWCSLRAWSCPCCDLVAFDGVTLPRRTRACPGRSRGRHQAVVGSWEPSLLRLVSLGVEGALPARSGTVRPASAARKQIVTDVGTLRRDGEIKSCIDLF
jgi:hypothetical protein